MRATDFTPNLDEVAMNPAAFAQAVEQGQQKGVLVGFEFEVCMPKDSFHAPEKEKVDWYKDIYNYWVNDDPEYFSELTQPFEYNGKSYERMEHLYLAFEGDKAAKDVRKAFDTLPEEYRIKYNRSWKRKISVQPELNNIMKFTGFIIQQLLYDPNRNSKPLTNSYARLTRAYHDHRSAHGAEFWKTLFGSTELEELLKNPRLKFDKESLINDYGQVLDSHDYSDYSKVSETLKVAIQPIFGKTKIFQEYHQFKKNMTDWYIEPDGSLEPYYGDGAAEVVSPPLPAQTAVEALKKFYGIAQQLHLYTNDSTGLHINVSIPEKLDVLKLAMFIGDEHVLNYWNRINSDYAESVVRSLRDDDDFTVKEYNPKTKNGMKMLQRIVTATTDQHTASISYNGKYVSFRHAGGDYLNDMSGVLNVVGRFVRSMIIASDPNAYRKEYLGKLVKMLQKNSGEKRTPLYAEIRKLKTTPIETAVTVMYGIAKKASVNKLIYKVLDYSGRKNQIPIPPQLGLKLANNYYNEVARVIRPGTKQKLDQYPNVRCAVLWIPGYEKNPDNDVSAMWDEEKRIGLQYTTSITLTPESEAHNAYISDLIKQYKAGFNK